MPSQNLNRLLILVSIITGSGFEEKTVLVGKVVLNYIHRSFAAHVNIIISESSIARRCTVAQN